MARKKLPEFRAKTLLFRELGFAYSGVPVILKRQNASIESIKEAIASSAGQNQLQHDKFYVVKVDEGVKGRMKKGLIFLKVATKDIPAKIAELAKKGYSRFLVEEYFPHESSLERYFSIERIREGYAVYCSSRGGIDIEQNQESVQKIIVTDGEKGEKGKIIDVLEIPEEVFAKILAFFDNQFISFMEVNPLVVEHGKCYFLDLAVEVDSAAEFFLPAGRQGAQNSWTSADYVGEFGGTTQEERNIIDLKAKSQAAFKFDLLNKDGSIWVLLSGGVASIVLADEVYNLGRGEKLANYGEYSGNPNQEETYIYTKNVLRLLLNSKAPKKTLIIGGGVANFTDVKATFRGVIRAMDEIKEELLKQGVKVFVRRGGPNQKAGLLLMKKFLQESNLYGNVVGPDVMITSIIKEAVEFLED